MLNVNLDPHEDSAEPLPDRPMDNMLSFIFPPSNITILEWDKK